MVAVPHTPTPTLLWWIAMDLIDNEWENFNRLQSGFMTPPPHEPEKLTELARSGFKRPSPDSPEAPLVSAGCAAPELAIDGPGATLGSDDGVGRGPTAVWKEMADGCQCGEQYTPDPPVVSVPVHRPPAASKDDEMSGGDGGCTATALSAVGVFSSTKEAVRGLDTEITPQHEKLIKERGHCEESEAGIRGERWHQEAVKRAVVAARWHFQTLPINPTQAGCVDLSTTLTSDSYLVVGVTNNQWWKGKTRQILKYPDWPADAPAKDTTGWVHSIAVVDGRVRDFQTHQPISAL